MKRLWILFVLGICCSVTAQNNCASGRYYSEVFSNTSSTSGIKFGEADPYGLINNQDLYLDIIEPVGDTLEKRPLVLHQFGGGFLVGWRTEPVIPQMGDMYAKRGFVFATIDYRLGFNALNSGSAERAVYRGAQDLQASLRFLIDNADTYGIDTSAIFITGTSAGCFAAFASTFMDESDRVDIPSTYGIPLEPSDLGCGSCSGNNNFNNQIVRVHGIINNWGAILDTSYIDLSTAPTDNVPVISFHGTNDNIVPYTSGYAFSLPIFPSVQGSSLIHQRLDNLGIKNRLFPLPGLGHEPQLLQLQTWVTDTIISQGSQFLYEIMYGDSNIISGDNTVCLNDTFTYSLPYHIDSRYCWTVSGGSIIQENLNEVQIVWNSLGTHLLTGTELDKREISKEAELTITVNNPPTPLIAYTSDNGLFEFTSTNNANSFTWNFGDGTQGIGNPISHQYADTGHFILSLSVEDDFCSNSKDSLLQSTLCPVAQFQIIQNDSNFILQNTSNFGISNSWILEDGSITQGDSLILSFNQEGSYSVSLISSNSLCNDTLTETFPITFCSQADFTYQANQLAIDFIEQTYNAFFHTWDFGDGFSSALPNPSHTYNLPGLYDVRLITTSANSCSDTLTKQINIDLNSSLFEANALDVKISPNPSKRRLNIEGLNPSYTYDFKIYSLEGKQLVKLKLTDDFVQLPYLQNGIYFITLHSQNQSHISKLIIKH